MHTCRNLLLLLLIFLLPGCESFQNRLYDKAKKNPGIIDPVDARIDQETSNEIRQDLQNLPLPKGKMIVSVYTFRDQSGQYQPQPANAFSTAMPQGTLPMLMQSLRESGWFNLVEREGLQNLLTERKILRATNEKISKNSNIAPLAPANIIIEGGVLAYDSNIKTGGSGAKYFGLSASSQYREDQVTVGLRVVDVNTGRIINTVTAQRKLLSTQLMGGFFRFVRFKRLLELETGVTQNDPAQVVVQDAIDAAVIKLVVRGILQGNWALTSFEDAFHPIFKTYAEPEAYQRYLNRLQKTQLQVKHKPPAPDNIAKVNPKPPANPAKLPKAPKRPLEPPPSSPELYPVVDQLTEDDLFSIQLFTAKSQGEASAFIDKYTQAQPQQPQERKFWIWKTPHKLGFYYVVLLGQYQNKNQAVEQLVHLPQKIQLLGPWVRPLQSP